MELPKSKVKSTKIDPRLMIIAGFQKSGKTTAVASLADNLIIDLEGGTDYMDAMKVKVENLRDFSELIRALSTEKAKYQFITIDTGTRLEDIAAELAVINYKKQPMGKHWTGTPKDILNLPNGAGYGYLRNAFQDLLAWLEPYCNTTILLCHIKQSSFQKDGEEVNLMDVDLTGKLKTIMAAKADAIGMFYRKRNQSILSFRGGESFAVEARPDHLRGKDFVVIESDTENKLTINWDDIFISEGV